MRKEVKEVSPWGVNAPFLMLSAVYFTLSLVELLKGQFKYHAEFAMIATYSMLYGMLLRLFFPANKYLPAHLAALVAAAVPIPLSQVASAVAVTVAEAWGLKDVRSYGSKFPVNYLVLSSPPASAVAWLAYYFTGDFNYLVPPVVLYVLGINVGVLAATLRTKPFFGDKQIPFLVLSAFSFIKPIYTFDVLAYLVYLLPSAKNFRTPSALLIASFLASAVSAYFLDYIHSVFLGLMLTSFLNCVVYSIARYNYGKSAHWASVALAFISSIVWDFSKSVSLLFTLIALLILYALIIHNFHPKAVRLGISVKFLRGS